MRQPQKLKKGLRVLSNQSIYLRLVSAGMSPAGACGTMGNMQAESAMRANNAQDGMTRLSDEEYTAAADNGSIDFVYDAVGYGLCQWTFYSRKRELLEFCKAKGVSVGNEAAQVDFCIQEVKEYYPELWSYLKSATGVYEAAERVCKEYERPAVNNIEARAQAANGFYMQFAGSEAADYVPPPTPETHPDALPDYYLTPDVTDESGVEDVAKKVSKETAYMLQALLVANGYNIKIDGIVGSKTKAAAKKFVASL